MIGKHWEKKKQKIKISVLTQVLVALFLFSLMSPFNRLWHKPDS